MSRDCQHGRLARSCETCADKSEIAELTELVNRQGAILRAVVIAVRGEPPALTGWSNHDAAERVGAAMAALAGSLQAVKNFAGEARVLRRLLAEAREVLATMDDDEASEQLAGLIRQIDAALDPSGREAQQMSITEASKDAP